MPVTFLHPLTCGFARGIAWQIVAQVDEDKKIKLEENETWKDFQNRLMRERYNRFTSMFQSCKENFPVDYKRFEAIFPVLREKFSRWNHRKIAERNICTATFNIKSWKELSPDKQIQHTFEDCKSCQLTYTGIQAYFPVKSNRYNGIQKQTNREFTTDVVRVTLHDQARTNGTSLREAGTAAKSLYDQINPRFQTVTGHSLAKALTNVKDLNIEVKKSHGEKKKARRSNYKKFKKSIENEWKNTSLIRYLLIVWALWCTYVIIIFSNTLATYGIYVPIFI